MMKILLVDDDAFLRDMYATKFTECGHTVNAVDSGVAALAVLQNDTTFDVVLLDMIMPGISGTELVSKAKEAYPDYVTKYIVLSNQGQDADISEAMGAGAHGYIIKAESIPSEVVKKVETLMKQAVTP
jgi:two-component system, sensor histidine kinase ChiS